MYSGTGASMSFAARMSSMRCSRSSNPVRSVALTQIAPPLMRAFAAASVETRDAAILSSSGLAAASTLFHTLSVGGRARRPGAFSSYSSDKPWLSSHLRCHRGARLLLVNSDSSTASTASSCAAAAVSLMSTTRTIRSASTTSSSVARNASTTSVGSFCTNPTVSVRTTCPPPGSLSRLDVGSSVANSLSSANAGRCVRVSAFSRVDLPAFV
mmetsp:Transcript_9611/g.21763  ORF Transcript_9611/g.21763 Transcript_9611/m.21763 type:complete len:212 (+) Transcript_9611:96-731(+)